MRTATPISVDNRIAIPVGSFVQGTVSHVKRSGRVKGKAELGIRLESLTLPGGRVLKFAPRLSSVDSNRTEQKVDEKESSVKQGPDHGKDTAQVVILAGEGAAIGGMADRGWTGAGIGGGIGSAVGLASVLATRGREVELRQGSSLDVVFDRPLSLD
jgi:type IV secretion system protein VirB10